MGTDLPRATLGAIATLRTEKAIGQKNPALPYVGLEHIESGSAHLRGDSRCGISVSTNSVFHAGDVLFGKLRPYLRKSARSTFSGYCSTDILVLQPTEAVAPAFAAKIFQSEAVFAAAVATSIGTRMPRTSWSALRDLEVFCPPLPEQHLIAQVLDNVDEAIRKTEQLIAKLKLVKQGLLQDLLTRGIDENGELRDPERHPEQFKDSVLGRIPREWEVAPFRLLAGERRAYLKTGPFGSSLKQEHWTRDGVPVVTIASLGEGEFVTSELLFVSDTTAERLTPFVLRAGDVVFSRVADVGRSVVVTERQEGWIMSSNLMRISLDVRRAIPSILQANLAANNIIKRQIRRFVNSGGRDVANAAIMDRICLAWPQFEEQRMIAGVLETGTCRLREERGALDKLRLLKAGLMDDLLTGRVRVTPLLDSPTP